VLAEQQTGLQRHTVRVSLVLIRHPMYSGFVLFALGTALMVGSWYGVLGAFCLIGLVARRAVLEERMLRKELAGYEHYMRRLPYRLLPHV